MKKLSLLLLAAITLGALSLYEPSLSMDDIDDGTYAAAGEALLHGVPASDASFRMPMASVLHALVFDHRGISWGRWLRALGALDAVLLLGLCALVSPGQTFLAPLALGLLCAARAFPLSDNPETFYSRLVLLVAGLLVWRQRKPTMTRTALLSLGIGASFLYRSPLVLLPVLLAALELRIRPRQAAVLLIVPFLFLLPWLRMNQALHARFIPFEDGAVDSNLVTGALGLVQTIDGPWQTLVDDPANARAWALREMGAHPWRTARAFVRRVWFVLRLHPVLWLLAAAGSRASPPLRLLILYYALLHCSMTVVRRYFEPLWPLAAVLAASALLPKKKDQEPAPAYLLLSCLAAALILAAYVEHLVLAYDAPRPAPRDAWILAREGRNKLEAGDFPGAVAALEESARLSPWTRRGEPLLLRAKALAGDPRPLLDYPLLPEESYGNREINVQLLLFKADARPDQAEALLEDAKRINDSLVVVKEPEAQPYLPRLRSQEVFDALSRPRRVGRSGARPSPK